MSKAMEFLKARGKPAPSHAIKLRLLGDDSKGQQLITEDVEACFRFVADDERLRLIGSASKALAKLDHPPSDDERRGEEAYHLLQSALRDDVGEPFFDSVAEAKTMLVSKEAVRLAAEYQHFLETNFPESLSTAEFSGMVEDAKVFSVGDLLKRYGYWRTRRALASLAVACGTSLTS